MSFFSSIKSGVAKLCQKVKDKFSLPNVSPEVASPSHFSRFKTFCSYAWKVVVDGTVRGDNSLGAILGAFVIPRNILHFLGLFPFLGASFLRKFGKTSQHTVLRLIGFISRELQESIKLMPPLVSLGRTLGLTQLGAVASASVATPGSIAVFCVSMALSILKRVLETTLSNKTPSAAQVNPSRFKKFLLGLKDFILPALKKAGQGALAKELFSFLALFLSQDGIATEESLAVSNSPWMNLFIAVPVALDFVLNLAKKIIHSKNPQAERSVDNAKLSLDALGDGLEIWAYATFVAGGIVEDTRSNHELNSEDYFICMGASAVMGGAAAARQVYKALKKRKQEQESLLTKVDGSELSDLESGRAATPISASGVQEESLLLASAANSDAATSEPSESARRSSVDSARIAFFQAIDSTSKSDRVGLLKNFDADLFEADELVPNASSSHA